jgi:hypothetical protein
MEKCKDDLEREFYIQRSLGVSLPAGHLLFFASSLLRIFSSFFSHPSYFSKSLPLNHSTHSTTYSRVGISGEKE